MPRTRDALIPLKQLTTNQVILRQIHKTMYPERYLPAEALAKRGISTDGGYSQWSADTPEAIAEVFQDHEGDLGGVIQTHHEPLP